MRRAVKYQPIDLDDNKRVGISIPFNGKSVFNSTFTTAQQLKSNLINLLLTDKGERFFDSEFGVGLRSLLFETITDFEFVKSSIIKDIEKYIPQLIIQDFVITDLGNNQINIYLKYSSETNLVSDEINLEFN